MKSIFLISLTLLSFYCSAQNYQIIFEIQNPESEIEAELITVALNDNFIAKSNISDSRFSITLPSGQHNIGLSYIGFESIIYNIEITKDTILESLFIPFSSELSEVRVTQKRLIDIDKPNIGVEKITIKELSTIPVLMGEIDIQRGLQTLPGVSSVGEGANGLNIRGGGADQNLLLLEGTPIYNPTHLFGLFSVIPSEAIGSIDLYKGAIPVRFGGRIASVIDVKSVEPSLTETTIKAGLGIISSKASIETPLIKEKVGLLVAVRSSFTGRLLKYTKGKLQKFEGGFNELFTKLHIRPNINNKISLNYFGTTDYTKFVGIALNSEGNNAEDSEVYYSISNASLKWDHAFGDKVFSNLLLANSVYRPKLNSPDSLINISVRNEIVNRKIGYAVSYNFNKENFLELGAESQLNIIQPGNYYQNDELIRSLPEEKSIESAFYGNLSMSLGDRLKAEIGLRYSIFNNVGPAEYRNYLNNDEPSEETVIGTVTIPENKIYNTYHGAEPRFSMVYLLNDQSSIKANFSVSRQYIQIIANNTTPLPISRWKTSDIHLKPQVSAMYSAGYFLDLPASKAAISAEIYFRKTQNYTDVRMGSDFLLKNHVETELLQGQNKAYGIETKFSKQFGKSAFSMNYTYSRSFNKIEGETIFTEINQGEWFKSYIDRPHAINANIKIQQGRIHHFSFAFTFASGRPFTAPNGIVRLEGKAFPVYRERNNERIPAYHRLDFSWMINNPGRNNGKFKSFWAFNIYNIYGHKNIYSVYFNNQTGALQAYRLSVFSSAIPSLSYNLIIN